MQERITGRWSGSCKRPGLVAVGGNPWARSVFFSISL